MEVPRSGCTRALPRSRELRRFLLEGGFTGPATVLEGQHGFYKAFAPSRAPDFAPLLDGLGSGWVLETVAFKPYACGTMTQPFIDCAIELGAVWSEGGRHRQHGVRGWGGHRSLGLWEPLVQKSTRPPNGYAAKFSSPYCIAVGFMDGKAGLEQFTDERRKRCGTAEAGGKGVL